jgi:hypothetical protein
MEILAALDTAAVRRLKSVWELLPRKTAVMWNGLQQLMAPQSNCASYRVALHSCQPPCVPYIGVYLTDLTYLDRWVREKTFPLAGSPLLFLRLF